MPSELMKSARVQVVLAFGNFGEREYTGILGPNCEVLSLGWEDSRQGILYLVSSTGSPNPSWSGIIINNITHIIGLLTRFQTRRCILLSPNLVADYSEIRKFQTQDTKP